MVKKQQGQEKKKMRFPVLTVILSAAVLMTVFASGMFVYATGLSVVDSTYMKMISHTEYRFGEEGQIVTRLVDYQGNAVVVQNCTASILYPNKTYFKQDELMTATGTIDGDHYYNFTTPDGPEGVYEYQATCNYLQGANPRNSSVTNSFHLSGAFNAVLGNLTNVQNNLTALSNELAAVNSSLSGDIADLSTQLNVNVTQLLNGQTSIKDQLNANITTVLYELNNANSSIHLRFDDLEAGLDNLTVNLTPVLEAIDALETSMAANFTEVFNEFSVVNTKLDQINVTVGDTNTRVQGVESTLVTMTATLDYINTTTVNTYQYVTGTLTDSVNQILNDMGVMNASINRIETVSNQINGTVTSILENQENEVVMTVFSG